MPKIMFPIQRGSISSMWCSEEEHKHYIQSAQIQAKWSKNELDVVNKTGEAVNRQAEKAIWMPEIITPAA